MWLPCSLNNNLSKIITSFHIYIYIYNKKIYIHIQIYISTMHGPPSFVRYTMGYPFSDEDDHQTWDIGSWECASHRRIILILHAYVVHVTQTWEGRVFTRWLPETMIWRRWSFISCIVKCQITYLFYRIYTLGHK